MSGHKWSHMQKRLKWRKRCMNCTIILEVNKNAKRTGPGDRPCDKGLRLRFEFRSTLSLSPVPSPIFLAGLWSESNGFHLKKKEGWPGISVPLFAWHMEKNINCYVLPKWPLNYLVINFFSICEISCTNMLYFLVAKIAVWSLCKKKVNI